VVWNLWSFLINRFAITGARYVAAQNAGLFLKTPRYPFFVGLWIVLRVYSVDRGRPSVCLGTPEAWEPGPGTALKVGFLAGFFAGFPGELSRKPLGPPLTARSLLAG
jgi:hypothetical protein